MPQPKNFKMMILLLSILVVGSAEGRGWIAVERDVYIPYHLETTPLEIRTDSELNSNDRVTLFLSTNEGHYAGGINLKFGSTVQYWIYDCSTASTPLPVVPPTETDKIWRISLNKTAGIRMVVHCNEVEVLNFVISNSTCGDKTWSTDWNREVAEIEFEVYDTASDYYRPRPGHCAAGTHRSPDLRTCEECAGNMISDKGADSCTPCRDGMEANSDKTECHVAVNTKDNTGSGRSLLIAWSLAGCFLLTTILAVIFAARKLLRRTCCRRGETPDTDKEIRLISPDSSVLTPDGHHDDDI